jgi:DNA mismatch repair ATPase MutS
VELAEHAHQSWHGLRDPSLALTLQSATVANDGNAGARQLIVITGANQGGKSTLLRALGQAQLMLHAGMFVAAEAYIAPLRSGVFTHYKREEDATMQSGKFDEELIRMSAIANTIRPGAVLLFNEPFASTNEREGSEIMLQVIDALRERGIAVWLVTHLVSGARTLYQRGSSDALFLRAERRDDGVRSFRLVEGEPLQTSFGEDLYRQVFSPQTREALSNAIVQN